MGGYAQTKKEFKQVWNKRMSQNDILNNPDGFIKDLMTYFLYKHDSIDFQIFVGPEMRTFYLYLLTMEALENKSGLDEEVFVFRSIDRMFSEMKKTPEYLQGRKMIIAIGVLQGRNVDLANWGNDKNLFKPMNISDDQLEDIRVLAERQSGKQATYWDLLQEYYAKMKDKINAEKARKKAEEDRKRIDFDRFREMAPGCIPEEIFPDSTVPVGDACNSEIERDPKNGDDKGYEEVREVFKEMKWM